jgi:hypothetical protein
VKNARYFERSCAEVSAEDGGDETVGQIEAGAVEEDVEEDVEDEIDDMTGRSFPERPRHDVVSRPTWVAATASVVSSRAQRATTGDSRCGGSCGAKR